MEKQKLTKSQGVRFIVAVDKLFRILTSENVGRGVAYINLENVYERDIAEWVEERCFGAYMNLIYKDGEFLVYTWMPRGERLDLVEEITAAFTAASRSNGDVDCPEYVGSIPLKKIVENG